MPLVLSAFLVDSLMRKLPRAPGSSNASSEGTGETGSVAESRGDRLVPSSFAFFALGSSAGSSALRFLLTLPRLRVSDLSMRDATTAVPSGALYSGGMPRIS